MATLLLGFVGRIRKRIPFENTKRNVCFPGALTALVRDRSSGASGHLTFLGVVSQFD